MKQTHFLMPLHQGGTIVGDEIVARVLRSLPPAYKHKVVAIDEIQSVTTLSRDMLVGKIVAFELSECGESHGNLEAAFSTSISVSGKHKYDLDECIISRYERERRDGRERKRDG